MTKCNCNRDYVTEIGTPSPDARIEKVRKLCNGSISGGGFGAGLARTILEILDAKPGRKRSDRPEMERRKSGETQMTTPAPQPAPRTKPRGGT